MFQTLRIRCFVSVPCVGTVSPWWKVASRGRNVGGRFAGSGGAAGSTGGFLESWSERVWPGQGDGHMPPDVLRCLGRCGCWFGTGGECVCEGQGREKEGREPDGALGRDRLVSEASRARLPSVPLGLPERQQLREMEMQGSSQGCGWELLCRAGEKGGREENAGCSSWWKTLLCC